MSLNWWPFRLKELDPDVTAANELNDRIRAECHRLGRSWVTVDQVDEVLHAIETLGLSVASLRHCGWLDPEDHSLTELDTDEEYVPPGTRPVWELGSTAVFVPPLDFLASE